MVENQKILALEEGGIALQAVTNDLTGNKHNPGTKSSKGGIPTRIRNSRSNPTTLDSGEVIDKGPVRKGRKKNERPASLELTGNRQSTPSLEGTQEGDTDEDGLPGSPQQAQPSKSISVPNLGQATKQVTFAANADIASQRTVAAVAQQRDISHSSTAAAADYQTAEDEEINSELNRESAGSSIEGEDSSEEDQQTGENRKNSQSRVSETFELSEIITDTVKYHSTTTEK